MSYSTPAALKAASSAGRSWVSQRAEVVVSGRMTPTFPDTAAPPPVALAADDEAELAPDDADELAAELAELDAGAAALVVLPELSELLPQAASSSDPTATRPRTAVDFRRMKNSFLTRHDAAGRPVAGDETQVGGFDSRLGGRLRAIPDAGNVAFVSH